eukprot:scpid12203/ scgid8758/ 
MPLQWALLRRFSPSFHQQCCVSLGCGHRPRAEPFKRNSHHVAVERCTLPRCYQEYDGTRAFHTSCASLLPRNFNRTDSDAAPLYGEESIFQPSEQNDHGKFSTSDEDNDVTDKMTLDQSEMMTDDAERFIDLEAAPGDEVIAEQLIIDKVKGASDLRRILNYMEAVEKPKSLRSRVNLGLVGLSFESLRNVIVSIMRDCGLTETQAFNVAICLRGSKPPPHLKETINVLLQHSISLNKILNEQRDSLLALLVVPPGQVSCKYVLS